MAKVLYVATASVLRCVTAAPIRYAMKPGSASIPAAGIPAVRMNYAAIISASATMRRPPAGAAITSVRAIPPCVPARSVFLVVWIRQNLRDAAILA